MKAFIIYLSFGFIFTFYYLMCFQGFDETAYVASVV